MGVIETPSTSPSLVIIPNDVILLRDNTPCIFQSNPINHPDRFKCMIKPTVVSNEPGSYGNDIVVLMGKDGCLLAIQPVTWAWDGNAFIFESSENLDTVNACFNSGTLITTPPVVPPTTSAPISPTSPTMYPTYTPPTMYPTQSVPTMYPTASVPTPFPTDTAPTIKPTIACKAKGESCNINADCCMNKCNTKKKVCKK